MINGAYDIEEALLNSGFFTKPGAYVLVDGQFGSTGKGLLASVLAERLPYRPDVVSSNAGPNSGHTFYGPDDEKVVLCQLPSYAIARLAYKNQQIPVFMNAGAIIDESRLKKEYLEWFEDGHLLVSPTAALADPKGESHLVSEIGSTGKGTGYGVSRKIMRHVEAVYGDAGTFPSMDYERGVKEKILLEVSQGFSLGIDAGFYPYCTSRNCTVSQAISDAGLHPNDYADSIMTVRTFPIRVAGNSGPGYPDQIEMEWKDLGIEPEFTTVTQKIRRIFTWSDIQFREALRANRPSSIFVNFMNYLEVKDRGPFMQNIIRQYRDVMGCNPAVVLVGFGPKNNDMFGWDWS